MTDKEKSPDQAHGGWAERLTAALGLRPGQANLVKWLAVFLALGILFLNAGPLFGVTNDSTSPQNATAVTAAPGQDELAQMAAVMSRDLEKSLSHIRGAGQVSVTITLEAGPTISPIQDTRVDKTTTTEKTADNSSRETVQTNTTTTNVLSKTGTSDALAVASRSRAKVAGVLITADGARVASVKKLIYDAAVTALGVSANRIIVEPSDGR